MVMAYSKTRRAVLRIARELCVIKTSRVLLQNPDQARRKISSFYSAIWLSVLVVKMADIPVMKRRFRD